MLKYIRFDILKIILESKMFVWRKIEHDFFAWFWVLLFTKKVKNTFKNSCTLFWQNFLKMKWYRILMMQWSWTDFWHLLLIETWLDSLICLAELLNININLLESCYFLIMICTCDSYCQNVCCSIWSWNLENQWLSLISIN